MSEARLIGRLLDVIADDILPLTRAGVARGSKIFGAAILMKSDLSLVIAETNNEIENPLWHGEMHAIKKLYERPRAQIPDPKDCIFLATHEPCSLCLSAITWGGYDNFWYFFDYEATRDAFAIPHDLNILSEVFAVKDGAYPRSNAFWTSHFIGAEIGKLPAGERRPLEEKSSAIRAAYASLSENYQADKGEAGIPLA